MAGNVPKMSTPVHAVASAAERLGRLGVPSVAPLHRCQQARSRQWRPPTLAHRPHLQPSAVVVLPARELVEALLQASICGGGSGSSSRAVARFLGRRPPSSSRARRGAQVVPAQVARLSSHIHARLRGGRGRGRRSQRDPRWAASTAPGTPPGAAAAADAAQRSAAAACLQAGVNEQAVGPHGHRLQLQMRHLCKTGRREQAALAAVRCGSSAGAHAARACRTACLCPLLG